MDKILLIQPLYIVVCILPSSPPQLKKTNSDIKTEFAFFFSRDFFGVRFKF